MYLPVTTYRMFKIMASGYPGHLKLTVPYFDSLQYIHTIPVRYLVSSSCRRACIPLSRKSSTRMISWTRRAGLRLSTLLTLLYTKVNSWYGTVLSTYLRYIHPVNRLFSARTLPPLYRGGVTCDALFLVLHCPSQLY